MKPLLEQRRDKFERLCDHISLLIGATSSTVSPSAHPTSPVSSGKFVRPHFAPHRHDLLFRYSVGASHFSCMFWQVSASRRRCRGQSDCICRSVTECQSRRRPSCFLYLQVDCITQDSSCSCI